jgi:hypothetical protein
MLPLKAFVNTLQHTLGNSDGLVLALAFLDGRLQQDNAWLVLEKPSDRFDI